MQTQRNYSESAERFGLVAQKYCVLIESRSALEKTEFLRQVYRLLPELLAEGMRLPKVEYDDKEEDEEQEQTVRRLQVGTAMTSEEWGQLYKSLKEELGGWDLYWQVFNPRTDNEAIHGSLADDLADVYRDLKNGIVLARTNKVPPRDIVFHWRLEFYQHWGKHLIDSLRVIHFLLEEDHTL